ncbi:MAG TPA: lysophospholipid acyltransferase family protein [Candidatus Dormibacteraeota bacterium]|nr:lysophospholipid acyltransferase family protein [Candidatus Dormibacteraeota bacterium]
MTDRRALGAPHRRGDEGFSRVSERLGVLAYRATSWILGRLPQEPVVALLGVALRASYAFWPTKRRWSNENFARVLGRDPGDPAVRRLALRAYATYARYLVELMRLPERPLAEVTALTEAAGVEELVAMWRASGKGLSVTVPHIGNNEAAAAGLAHHGLPISGVADDTGFPELLELLTRQREAWGVRTILWRNLREMFSVLRRGEILVLLIDWGYRPDGIPVRLFGHWTTLPAGPAVLAARTRVPILPVAVRRHDGRYIVTHDQFITVASQDPAEIQRATQAVAGALERAIAEAPDQWYSFKPMWPSSAEEAAELARRAGEMSATEPPAATSTPAGRLAAAPAGAAPP